MPSSPPSSPELNPLSVGDLKKLDGSSDPLSSSSPGADGIDSIAPLPAYKSAGEIAVDFDGLLKPPVPALRLREDLKEGCGGQTWPAGMLLARHMLRYHQAEMAGARILELGAGGGLTGLAVALNRSHSAQYKAASPTPPPVFVTDQLPMFALMEHNIALNSLQGTAKALVLNWGEPLPQEVHDLRPNIILAADCVYFEPAFPLLLTTMADLLALPTGDEAAGDNTPDASAGPTIYFCFKKRRRADMQFFKQAQKRFTVTEIEDVERPVFSRQGLFLYAITRKAKKTSKAASNGQAKGPKQANGQVEGPKLANGNANGHANGQANVEEANGIAKRNTNGK